MARDLSHLFTALPLGHGESLPVQSSPSSAIFAPALALSLFFFTWMAWSMKENKLWPVFAPMDRESEQLPVGKRKAMFWNPPLPTSWSQLGDLHSLKMFKVDWLTDHKKSHSPHETGGLDVVGVLNGGNQPIHSLDGTEHYSFCDPKVMNLAAPELSLRTSRSQRRMNDLQTWNHASNLIVIASRTTWAGHEQTPRRKRNNQHFLGMQITKKGAYQAHFIRKDSKCLTAQTLALASLFDLFLCGECPLQAQTAYAHLRWPNY